jgi:predicted nucleic acid-binding protein
VLAVVDTGPLYAAADETDANHESSLETLERADLELVIPALVVAETTYLIGGRLGAAAEASFLAALADLDVEGPTASDWPRIAKLVEDYADFPLGGTDASVVALAERLDTDTIITFDRRHFAAIRPAHRTALRLLPE